MTSSARWFLLVLVAFLDTRRAFSSTRGYFSLLLPAPALLLGALFLFNTVPAEAQNTVLVSNLGLESPGGQLSSEEFAHAQGFTTGSADGGYTLASIEARLGSTPNASERATIRAELWSAASGGGPDSKVADLTVPSGVTVGTVSFAAANTPLSEGTTYYFVLYTTGNYDMVVRYTGLRTEENAQVGWSIENKRWFVSSQQPGGGTFESTSHILRIRVNGAAQTTPTTPTMAPAAPTGLTVTPGTRRLELEWTAPSDVETGYDVHYTSAPKTGSGAVADDAVASGNDATAAWVDASHTGTGASKTIMGLTNDVTYRVRVRGVNNVGNGEWSLISGTPSATKSGSMDATLSALALSYGVDPVSLTPAFSSATYAYTANVETSVSRVAVTPTANEPDTIVRVGVGTSLTAVTSGMASDDIGLSYGTNRITAEVTAETGVRQTYTIIITRQPPPSPPILPPPSPPDSIPPTSGGPSGGPSDPGPAQSSDATLSGLMISGVSLSFNPETYTYTVNVYGVTTVTVTPTANHADAEISVNGYPVQSGSSAIVTLDDDGETTIEIEVTAEDGTTRTYTVTVMYCPGEEREILKIFYDSTEGDMWEESSGWNTENLLDNWHGVQIRNGRVAVLSLPDNRLSGEIPEALRCFGGLKELLELDLSDNSGLEGELPRGLSELNNLGVLDIRCTGIDVSGETEEWTQSLGEGFRSGCDTPPDDMVSTQGDGGCAVGASQERVGASALLVAVFMLLAVSRGLRARSY